MRLEADDHLPGEDRVDASRTYGIAFSEVWDALLQALGSFRGWQVSEANPRAGTVRATTTNPLGYLPLEGRFTLSLDELGQTQLEIRFEAPNNVLLGRASTDRSRRLIRRLERLLRASGRG